MARQSRGREAQSSRPQRCDLPQLFGEGGREEREGGGRGKEGGRERGREEGGREEGGRVVNRKYDQFPYHAQYMAATCSCVTAA